MKTYFFVPANRLNKINQIQGLGVNDIIIDLEDAVKTSEVEDYINILSDSQNLMPFYIRLTILTEDFELNLEKLHQLCKAGYNRFVIPKLQDMAQIDEFFTSINPKGLKFILLIETPRLFLELQSVLVKYSSQITAVGIGSHDLLSLIGAKHTLKNLEYVRQTVLYHAKAYKVDAIDYASMNIQDEKAFLIELNDSIEKGYDAKFFIHPWQIKCYNKIKLYSSEDLEWAKAVYREFEKINFDSNEFNAIRIDNQIIEKPHLDRAVKIMEYVKHKK